MTHTEPSTALPELSRGQVRSARALLSRKGRQSTGRFLAEGRQAVREALQAEVAELVIVSAPATHTDLLLPAKVPVVLGSAADVASLCSTVTPQGIVAVCRQQAWRLEQIVRPQLVVIGAQVRDPGNAGTVIRCADAFGADAVVWTHGCVETHNPKTVRASVGSIFHVPIVEGVSLAEAVDWAHQQGMQVLATSGEGERLDDLVAAGLLRAPTAWIMGNEAWGLPAADRELADRLVGVPMWGRAESLNLSTAAAICLYSSAVAQHSTPAR